MYCMDSRRAGPVGRKFVEEWVRRIDDAETAKKVCMTMIMFLSFIILCCIQSSYLFFMIEQAALRAQEMELFYNRDKISGESVALREWFKAAKNSLEARERFLRSGGKGRGR